LCEATLSVFLADRNGRAIGTVLRLSFCLYPSVVVCNVKYCG